MSTISPLCPHCSSSDLQFCSENSGPPLNAPCGVAYCGNCGRPRPEHQICAIQQPDCPLHLPSAAIPEQAQEHGDQEATQQDRLVELSTTTPGQVEYSSAGFSGVGTIHVDALNRVEEALRKLRPQVEAALIDNAEAELKVVRADPASLQKQNALKTAVVKIFARLAINAADAGLQEVIHELLRSLFGG